MPCTSSAAQSVTVTNTGTANLTISAVTTGGTNAGDFAKSADTCTGATVTPESTCTVSVTFTPTYVGSRTASLNFTGIAPNNSQMVTLSGFGIGADASLSPTSLTFPDQFTETSSARTITLTNPGNMTLTLSMGITGTNSGDFAQTNTCGSSVGAAANCSIKVTFTPSALGIRTAALTITDNGLDSPQTVILTGTGASSLPFINQPLVPTSVAPGGPGFTLTVHGTGFGPGATLNWNGVALATTLVDSRELSASVPAANIVLPGTAWVTAVNPGTDLISNPVFLPVAPSVPIVNFSAAGGSPVAVGTNPSAIAVGDFNRDGKLDLVVVNSSSNLLTILLGNGDGTFTPAPSPSTGDDPGSVVVGDFNGDGIPDLAVTNQADSNLTILLGNGDGTFMPGAFPSLYGAVPYAVVAGDFNGDGKLDLAVANSNDQVTILLGNGDGTFTPTASPPNTGNIPVFLAVGDFNGDGWLDLAVANLDSDSITILLGNGDGSFTPAASSVPIPGPSNSAPFSLAVADFNQDGKPDLVVAVPSEGTMMLLGNGDGTFEPAASLPSTGTEPIALAVGDFNADGILDLAVSNAGSGNVTLLLGKGDGTFTAAVSSPSTEAIRKFNGRGRFQWRWQARSGNGQLCREQRLGIAPVGADSGGQRLVQQPDIQQSERRVHQLDAAGYSEQHG